MTKNYFAGAMLLFFLLISGCTPTTSKTVVEKCDVNDSNKEACENSKLAYETNCQYDDLLKLCRPELGRVPPVNCSLLDGKEDECKDSDRCLWDTSSRTPVCKSAGRIAGTCEAVERKEGCDLHKNISGASDCRWDLSASKCVSSVGLNQITYFEFEHRGKVGGAKATNNSVDISAIGKNGDESLIYFGTNSNKNEISTLLTADNVTVTHAATKEVVTGDGTKGKANLNANAVVKSIVAGPGDTAVIAIVGATPADAGILEMKGSAVRGAWKNTDAHLGWKKSGQKISALVVHNNSWVAFGGHPKMKSGFFPFGANLKQAATGFSNHLGNNLDVIVTAAVSDGTKMYLASVGQVIEHTVKALTDNVDMQKKNAIITGADFKIAAGNNDDISALALVGDYLLIGLEDKGPGTGDVAVLRLSDKKILAPVWQRWGVRHIGVSNDRKTALISTTNGLIFFYDGSLIHINMGNVDKLTAANASRKIPVAIINDTPTGFDAYDSVGAVHIGATDTWYVGIDNGAKGGIFRLEMKQKQKMAP